ncbi:MAG: hypothetical protein U9R00_02270 [Patescibacteria group bacterium]|nr:hypothetical protein [Patescibacteria group bacterium]
MNESYNKQERDILAMKRVARDTFYPHSTSELINNSKISDNAFIPEHIKQEGRILLQELSSPYTETETDNASIEAFTPKIPKLGDVTLARDVFFPSIEKDIDSPRFISNYSEELSQLLNECQKAIDAGQDSYAKKLYNQLRVTFLSSYLENEEKEELYNKIQSLYDQINIKYLEAEAKKRLL